MQRYVIRSRPRKLFRSFGPDSGPEERLLRLRMTFTQLVRYERIEKPYGTAAETRDYAERLINMAIQKGDKDYEMMEMADFWLLEKDLIHKLFKVLVPRFKDSEEIVTNLYKLPQKFPGNKMEGSRGVLELKGNPWPPVIPRYRDNKKLLTNVLLKAMREDYYNEKFKDGTASMEIMRTRQKHFKNASTGIITHTEQHSKYGTPV